MNISFNFLPLQHNVEFLPGATNSVLENGRREISMFLVKRTPAGTVTITTTGGNANVNVNSNSTNNIFVFPATAFKEGQVYSISVRKVVYGNGTDQTDAPLVALY